MEIGQTYKIVSEKLSWHLTFAILFFLSFNVVAQTLDTIIVPNYISQDTQVFVDTVPEVSARSNKKSSSKKNKIEHPFEHASYDSTQINLVERKIRCFHNSEINYQTINLKAENIILNMDDKTVVAYGEIDSLGNVVGKPVFKDKSEEFEADTIVYNFDTKKGLIKGVLTKQDDGYLHSEINKKLANDQVCIKNGKYTTCDLAHPHFYLALSKAKVIPKDKIVSGPAYLVIEDIITPVGIPFGFFPNRPGGASGIIIPRYGDDKARGIFLQDGGYYFYINDYVDTKIMGDIYSNGSWALSNETRYKWRYHFNGQLYGKYSKFIRNFDEPNKTSETTYNIKWTHQQDPKLNPYSRLSANVNFGSSKYKLYNQTPQNNRLSTSQNSSISYNRKFANSPFNLSINARQSQNTNISGQNSVGKMNISLPEVNLSMSRIYPFKRKKRVGKELWYEKIGVNYSGNMKNSVTGLNEDSLWTHYALTQFRNGIQHRIPVSVSLKMLKYINISPSFSWTERWYFKSLDRHYNVDSARIEIDTINGFARSGDFNITVPLTTKLYGMYQVAAKNSYIKAMRHIVTPTISFSWRPDFSDPKWGEYQEIYDGNDSLVGTYSRFRGGSSRVNGQKINSWSGIYGTAPTGKSGKINFNLNNNLELKVRNKKDTVKGTQNIKLLDRLSFRTGYNMAVDSLNWDDISITAGAQIARVLNINFSMSLNPYDYNRTTGREVNSLLWKKGDLGRLTRANLSTSIGLNSDGLKKDKPNGSSKLNENEKEVLRTAGISDQMIDMGYADFSMPWQVNLRYSVNYSNTQYNIQKQVFEENITQTFNVDGNINITPNWRAQFRSGWDFQKKEVSYTSMTIMRDLHCWEMSFNWVPFGRYQSYFFKINVKATMFQDLKYEQRRSWLEDL